MQTSRVTPEHIKRRALVYVRQSTQNQVHDNLESQRRQYALADVAKEMGFTSVDIIDDDLGRSGSGRVSRPGFERLFGQLAAGDVGAVFCLEASRLARNGRDWHTLLEVCAMVGALIIDPDGAYDPKDGNDRLMLGLKGTLSEYELTLLRQRALAAIDGKAKRGELRFCLPPGLVWTLDGRIELNPDQRIQEAIRLVFRKFDELGSARQVFLWLRQDGVKLPTIHHARYGSAIEWVLPVVSTVGRILTSPFYAGAYAWGRTEVRAKSIHNRRGRTDTGRRKPVEQWRVLIRDHHPGYISWEVYERNLQRTAENAHKMATGSRKAARGGKGLLAGLVRCRRCGRRLYTSYNESCTGIRLFCRGSAMQEAAPCRVSFVTTKVEEAISAEILRAVEKPAIEAALEAAERSERAVAEQDRIVEVELEHARYQAHLARRRYEGVDPDNRLVATELERQWNDSLTALAKAERKLSELRASASQRPALERETLVALARDLPSIWHDKRTDMRTKQRIVRILIDEVLADLDETGAHVLLVIHWAGGRHSDLRVRKRARGEHRFATSLEAEEIIRLMVADCDDRQIAITLNRLNLRTGHGIAWTSARIRAFRYTRGYTDAAMAEVRASARFVTLRQAAKQLGVNSMTVRRFVSAKILTAEQVVPYAPWRIPAASLESEEVLRAVAMSREKIRRPRTHSIENQTPTLPGL